MKQGILLNIGSVSFLALTAVTVMRGAPFVPRTQHSPDGYSATWVHDGYPRRHKNSPKKPAQINRKAAEVTIKQSSLKGLLDYSAAAFGYCYAASCIRSKAVPQLQDPFQNTPSVVTILCLTGVGIYGLYRIQDFYMRHHKALRNSNGPLKKTN